MEGARRRAQNTRRMDSARRGGICRRFVNGSCTFGPRCIYRHEWPVQICRYFQKGGCWYGERCRYLHVLQPGVDVAVAGRRNSVPTVSSSNVAYAPPDRRGSEPALAQAEVTSRQQCNRSGLLVTVSNPQSGTGHLAADIAEEQSQDTDSSLTANSESSQGSDIAQACAREERNEQETSSSETQEDGAAAASSIQREVEETEAFLRSENMTCGICMDKVYENKDSRNRVFGILPNCNHAFCLQCIMTWRKTRDLGSDVVKTCPQCRVRSAFYVPNKYWVEGQEKESVIAAFKGKFSSKSCRYYTRFGCCPFKTECLYRHDKRARRRSIPYPMEDNEEEDYGDLDLLNVFIAMTLLSGGDDHENDSDEDDYDFPFYLSAYGF